MTALTEADRAELAAGARAAFAPHDARTLMTTRQGWEPRQWQQLCTELGVAGLAVPEEHGGAGWGCAELGAVFSEAGRSLLCAPLFSVAALAVPQLLLSGDEAACARWLPSLVAGSLVATVAAHDLAGRHADRVLPAATSGADGWTVTGGCGFVTDAATADLLLVPAATPSGVGLFAVERPHLRVQALDTLDLTRKQGHVQLAAAPATLVGSTDAAAAVEAGFDVARAMLACEQSGGADRVLELTVAHAKSRIQFGRPIGSFQAVKQKCADMLIAVESAKSAAVAAAGDPSSVNASVAHAFCSEAYVAVAGTAIQLHGGIGFTWEHDAHLYYKRARSSEQLLGTPTEHRESLARHLERAVS